MRPDLRQPRFSLILWEGRSRFGARRLWLLRGSGEGALVETGADPARRMEFATKLIAEKIANSIETVRAVIPPSRSREAALSRLQREHDGLHTQSPDTVARLLGIEGRAGAAYFKAWEGAPLRWKATARRPISDNWRAVGPRASLHGTKAKNVRASHPVNAMLNYAYAVLQSQVQIEMLAAGYDPTLGIMHHGYQGSPALVFDLMEPRRPKADAAVLALVLSETFSGADFVIRSDGVVRLVRSWRGGCPSSFLGRLESIGRLAPERAGPPQPDSNQVKRKPKLTPRIGSARRFFGASSATR